MIKVLTKSNRHQSRFKTEQMFSDNEVDAAFEYADRIIDHRWAVQIKSKPWYSNSYSEIRTQYNANGSNM